MPFVKSGSVVVVAGQLGAAGHKGEEGLNYTADKEIGAAARFVRAFFACQSKYATGQQEQRGNTSRGYGGKGEVILTSRMSESRLANKGIKNPTARTAWAMSTLVLRAG